MTQPFTYRVTHLPTGRWYYGVRYKNDCSISDLWTKYFTSSAKVKNLILQDGKESFKTEIRKQFSNVEAAIDWEKRVLRKILGWQNCLNGNAFPAVLPEHRFKSHATKRKIGNDGLTGYERAMKKWQAKKHLINLETGNTFEEDRIIKSKNTRNTNFEKNLKFKKDTRERVTKNNPMHDPNVVEKVKQSLKKRVAEGTFPTTKGRKFPQISEKLKGKQFTLGLCWYNNGEKNFRFRPDDPQITSLSKGRINLKNSSASKGFKYEVVNCPHCDKSGGILNMKRYHFDKCKLKKGP